MELDIAIGESYGKGLYLCAKECFCEKIWICQANQLDTPGVIGAGAGSGAGNRGNARQREKTL